MTVYRIDLYNSQTGLICRMSMKGEKGFFTSGIVTRYDPPGGLSNQAGLWSRMAAEVYVSTIGTRLAGIYTNCLDREVSEDWIACANQLWPVIGNTLGCICGTWNGGGIHSDYCIPSLVGKHTNPY